MLTNTHHDSLVKTTAAIFPKTSNTPTISYRCLNNADWKMLTVNGLCIETLDCAPTKLISGEISLGKLIHPSDGKMVWDAVQNALMHRVPYQLFYRVHTPLHNEKFIFEQGCGVFVNDEFTELTGFISDITSSINPTHCDKIEILLATLSKEIIEVLQKTNKNSLNKKQWQPTIREAEVLIYVCQGRTMKEIACKLNLSPRTIEMHLYRIKLKLGCYTKSELKKIFFATDIGKKLIMML